MAEVFPIAELAATLDKRLFPTVTVWNRLEGRPRTQAFDRALRAEVRDALWMLSRQWQLGEFHGEDAGSPIQAKLSLERTRLTRYRPGEHSAEDFDETLPLEATVERRPLRFGLDVRAAMGRYWLKLIGPIGNYRQEYLDEYPIAEPDPVDEAHADRAAHPEVWQAFAGAAGRVVDGGALLERLKRSSSNHASDGIALAAPAHGPLLDAAGVRFVAWAERVFLEPPHGIDDSWEPPRMEYQFECSAPVEGGERVLAAEEYHGGRLDWYSVDVDPDAASLGAVGSADAPVTHTFTALPTPVEFEGMPNARWWAFEDRRTNLGKVDAATTDVAKLLFLEFALVFSNDWFVLPCTLDAGSVATVRGMAVTNVFGERTWIEPAGSGPDDAWQRWSMFTLSIRGHDDAPADRSLLLLPTVPKTLEGDPVEEVMLVHDEMANMAWAVETTVPLPDGVSRAGAETALETRAFFERVRGGTPPARPFETGAKIRYEAMTDVPEQWIPLVPVHVPGSDRAIQLQRAALPRFIDGDPAAPALVRPHTSLMRVGLDEPVATPYYVYEEEVPRSGSRVRQSWQRTRWRDGSVVLWLGARKGIGRPTASSGLAFDQAVDVPVDDQ
jgi:hypothetical protein